MSGATQEDGCGTHATLGAELRAVAVLLLDRLAPVLERTRTGAAQTGAAQTGAARTGSARTGSARTGSARTGSAPTGAACAGCPVCAALALLRGERPELAARLAEHASALLDALAAALEEPAGPDAPGAAPAPARRVQRIRVERPAPVR